MPFTSVTFLLKKFYLSAHATESVCIVVVVVFLTCHFLPASIKKESKSRLCFHLAQFSGLNVEILSFYRNNSLSHFLCCAFYQSHFFAGKVLSFGTRY